MKLYTIGYEGHDLDEFITTLKKNKIKNLIDIRKNPVSRKRGFSKNKLREALAEQGIEYHHLGELGVPSEWRKQAKEEIISRKKMFSNYVSKILPKEDLAIRDIITLAKKKKSVLLCYEREAMDCHRFYLSKEIQKREPTEVLNLLIPERVGLGISA